MVFSDPTTKLGIVQQARGLVRLDSTQLPVDKIVASSNNYLDEITGYAIGADKRFQWDDTNHSKLPEGTTPYVSGQSDYSFLTDQQGNRILTLLGISRLDSASGLYIPLEQVDRNDPNIDVSIFGNQLGTPTQYDKIADNIIRLDFKPTASTAAALKFFFQRTASYFVAADTTKEPGVATLLHRGFVIASAYDAALTLGLQNLQPLSVEMMKERQKMIQYFSDRNRDVRGRMTPARHSNK